MILQQAGAAVQAPGTLDRLLELMRTPIPDTSLWMAVVLLVVLFLLFRTRNQRVDLGVRAEEVLRERFARGEISRETYQKMIADVRVRPKF